MHKLFITSIASYALASVAVVSVTSAAEDLVIRKGAVIERQRADKPAAPSAASSAEKSVAQKPVSIEPVKPAARTAKRKGQAIVIKPALGQSAAAAWDDYYAAWKKDQPKDESAALRRQMDLEQDIRETARQLMSAAKFDEVVATFEAALRNGVPQPWMYEAMSLAMQAAGSSPAQLERAYMSAADYAVGDVNQMIYLAQRMAKAGLDRRALRMMRDIHEYDATRTEPLVAALAIAQRLDDVESIRWATLAVLSQEWSSNERKVYTDALRLADATIAKLESEKRAEVAAQFKRDRDAALARDVVIRVRWTGDADIDLSVLEPSGTVCSFREPRTTSGGVILGDTFSRDDAKSADGYTETYICPQAYSGVYQLMVRKVWGKVTSGQVKVEVIRNQGTAEEKKALSEVDLADGTNVVRFELPEGRRTEPLAQVRVANAVRDQAQVGRHVLAQQLGAALDPRAVAAAAAARAATTGNGNALAAAANDGGFIPVPFPVVQGAVGFRPVITTLPAGANLAASAVISADRRYVRITALPLFSKIGKVLAFNIITGSITDGNPDVGGGGNGGGGNGGGAGGGPAR